ncbi:MAG: GGDEF domain-containing protein [Cytophagaceae bacterium]|nr:GGDEF domain-containing protein [Gemmatimonadaceae bacterium]
MPSLSPDFVTRVAIAETGLRARWRRFWEPPEQFLLDAGQAGELLIARIRVLVTSVLLVIPVANIFLAPAERAQHLTGLLITLAAFVLALLVYAMVARDRRQRWLPLATSFFDVTLISLANLSFAFVSDPHVVVNSKVTFDTYFIALGGTALRFDRRVALVTGLMAIVQFIAVIGWVALAFPLDRIPPAGAYGVFSWADQVSRVVLLAAATVLNVYIVRGIQKQRELSNADPLTGVFNRRFFDDYILSEIARAARFQGRMAVAMIDVDWFKQFNDRYGHAAGDRALKNVARAMQLAVRRSDLVARYGGEEFVVLLRETDAAQALERVEQIRRAIQEEPHEVGDAHPVNITVSAGVAAWPEDGNTVGDLMATADRRLFQAKDAGRNQVVGPEMPMAHAAL